MSFSTSSQFTDSVLLHIRLNLRRRGITVPRNSLTRYTARHLRIRRLVQFIFAGPVSNNALTNCATRVCCACVDETTCVAERYPTLRIRGYMSARSASLRKKKSSAVPLLRRGHMSAICAVPSKGKGEIRKRVENRRLSTLLCARAASAQFRSPRRRNPLKKENLKKIKNF